MLMRWLLGTGLSARGTKAPGFRKLPGWWRTHMRTPTPWDAPTSRPHTMYLFIWLTICILYHALYNKPVNLRVPLTSMSSYSWLSNLRRGCRTPQFVAKLGRSAGKLETYLWLASEVGAVLWVWALNLWCLFYSGSLVSELNLNGRKPGCWLQGIWELLHVKTLHIWCWKYSEWKMDQRMIILLNTTLLPYLDISLFLTVESLVSKMRCD